MIPRLPGGRDKRVVLYEYVLVSGDLSALVYVCRNVKKKRKKSSLVVPPVFLLLPPSRLLAARSRGTAPLLQQQLQNHVRLPIYCLCSADLGLFC